MATVLNQAVRPQDQAQMVKSEATRHSEALTRARAQFGNPAAPTSPDIYPSYSGIIELNTD